MRKFLASLLTAVMIFSMPTGVQGAAAERAEINRAAVDIASVMQNIMTNYKGDITVQELYEAALSGIAAALDEHSRYISAADLTTFRQTQEGSSLAFGLVFSLDEGGRVVVRDVADGSPAYNAGISPHSVITRVDGVDLTAENYTDI
ncbi:MAG: hypothetical protein FWD98_02210, partial [Defluviitaleaceae bacterium]|nr:hypothetical protein [Defluviitaleaceae bacterium]